MGILELLTRRLRHTSLWKQNILFCSLLFLIGFLLSDCKVWAYLLRGTGSLPQWWRWGRKIKWKFLFPFYSLGLTSFDYFVMKYNYILLTPHCTIINHREMLTSTLTHFTIIYVEYKIEFYINSRSGPVIPQQYIAQPRLLRQKKIKMLFTGRVNSRLFPDPHYHWNWIKITPGLSSLTRALFWW